MAHRRLKLPPPAPKAEVEIQDALLMKADLDLPKEGDFVGYITEEEIMDLPKPQRKFSIRFSAMEQYSDWQTERLAELWTFMRILDANACRDRLELAKAKEARTKHEKRMALLKWIGATFGAGLIAASGKSLMEWLAK